MILFILLGLFLGIYTLQTPIPNSEDDSTFNTKYAIEYIQEISEYPHSVYDEVEHENVRLYLKDKLTEFLGAENVIETHYDRSEFEDEIEYDVDNLMGVIPGKNEEGILIVGHYDSRGHIGRTGELGNSYGAADDGYAIAFMLEVARLYQDKTPENSIYLLMTDAEETGLYGAKKAADDQELMDKIGFVINIEARGIKGPVYMFETSTNNRKVIDFYKKTDLPVSYSLATAVYTVMPNSTDFTEFLAEGKSGINFAVLNGLYYYHTPHDSFVNINSSSIEHYGRTILPLVDEFANNEKYSDINYFEDDTDKIFFTLLPNVFIEYSETLGTVLHIILTVVMIGMITLFFIKKDLNISLILKGLIAVFGSIVSAVILGNLVGRFIAFISKVPFNMTYVRTSYGGLPSLITLVSIFALMTYLYNKKVTESKTGIIVVGTTLNLLIALLTGFVLSGASFLFLIPGFSGLILVLLMTFCKRKWVKNSIIGLLIVLNTMIVIPILFSLYLALTIGGLLALGAILTFYLFFIVPAMNEFEY